MMPAVGVVTRPGDARPVTPVGILGARLAELVRRYDDGVGDGGTVPDAAFGADLRAAHALAAGLEPYVAACTSPESPALRALAERTAGHDWTAHTADAARAPLEQEMLSGHVEGRLLAMLVHATRSRRVLDVGMFTGYSALAVAEALPADGRVVACEIDAGVAGVAAECFAHSPVGERIDVRIGPALDSLRALADAGETFDLVFVDADKAGYRDYVDTVLDTCLLAHDGLLCVDNTLLQGLPWTDETANVNAAAIAQFNRALAADPRVEQVLLAVRDGVTLARRADR